MDATTALAMQQQLFQMQLGMALLRSQHQVQQTLLDVLAAAAQPQAVANPPHLGQSVDVMA